MIDTGHYPSFLARLSCLIPGVILTCSLSLMMLRPARFLVKVFAEHRVPRGISDIAIGGLCGSLWLVSSLYSGGTPSQMDCCWIFGGLTAGFVFWREQGYPDASPKLRRAVELLYRRFPKWFRRGYHLAQ